MRCPRCSAELKVEQSRGIEVDRCPNCRGLWLDYTELDQLEDVVLDKDEVKGTLAYSPRPSDISCPRCEGPMKAFNYRAWDLELDLCEKQHGFWLIRGKKLEFLSSWRRESRSWIERPQRKRSGRTSCERSSRSPSLTESRVYSNRSGLLRPGLPFPCDLSRLRVGWGRP